MSLRQGPQRDAASFNELIEAGFNLPLDRAKPAPASVAVDTSRFDDVEPVGKFSGRFAAESRALALSKGQKLGVSLYATQIKGAWCVVKTDGKVTVYVEG